VKFVTSSWKSTQRWVKKHNRSGIRCITLDWMSALETPRPWTRQRPFSFIHYQPGGGDTFSMRRKWSMLRLDHLNVNFDKANGMEQTEKPISFLDSGWLEELHRNNPYYLGSPFHRCHFGRLNLKDRTTEFWECWIKNLLRIFKCSRSQAMRINDYWSPHPFLILADRLNLDSHAFIWP